MRFTCGLMLAGCLVALGACASGVSHDEESVASHEDTIAWFDGDVDAAFAAAKQENRPLLLYWGTEWCPPCQHLKTTTFKQPEFIAKTRDFIPVYLDGDEERAQILGEELGVDSFPTVLVYSPAGREVMRMPRNIDTGQYVGLLDASLKKMRPISEVLAEVMTTGPADADPGDLGLLAFYSWEQNKEVELDEKEAYDTAHRLYEETPEELAIEKSRFLALALRAAADLVRASEDEEAAAATIPAADRAAYRAGLVELLANPDLRSSNLPFLVYDCRETIDLLHPEPTPERAALRARWDEAARRIEEDDTRSVDERLKALVARVWLARPQERTDASGSPDLPAELLDHVRERVTWAAETVTDEHELQAVMNTMASVLEESGLGGEAEALLAERMDDTHAPYYFMGWIGGIKKDAGEADEAVAWYRKAYENARGRYSRFRWGSIYLRQVMELTPEDQERIESDSLEILGELLTFEDAFAGGNRMRLDQLDEAYRSWNESGEHDDRLERIRSFVHARCDDFAGGVEDPQRSRCLSFLTATDPSI